jgi:ATP-dependent Lon protease
LGLRSLSTLSLSIPPLSIPPLSIPPLSMLSPGTFTTWVDRALNDFTFRSSLTQMRRGTNASQGAQHAPTGAETRMTTENHQGRQSSPEASEQVVPLLPLRTGLVLPGSVVTLPVGRRRSRALAQSVPVDALIAVAVQRDASIHEPGLEDIHPVAALARVRQKTERGERGVLLVVEGVGRFEPHSVVERDPFLRVRGVMSTERGGASDEARHLADALRRELGAEHEASDRTFAQMLRETMDAGRLADRLAVWVDAPHEARVEILLERDVVSRLRKVLELVGKARASAELRETIDSEVRRELGKNQKEVVLREQLRAIKKQLGDKEDELAALRAKLAGAQLPAEAREQVDRELSRLEAMGSNAPDAQIARKYLELVADLPWGKRAPASDDLGVVEQVLADDHEGLEEPKRRILEHMAVLKLKGSARGTILCFVGPPGVGKTSLAQSVATATGRPLSRIALGGVRDEAEIRGHRRTYIGALPGRILAGLRKAGVMNPVMVLDEVDKLGRGWQGDPEAALLEVLDPEQNHSFTDHYLELPFDLSEVLFIATANDLSQLSAPLRDRLEIIEISGYTTLEKESIAAKHLLPKELERHGLPADALSLGEGVLDRVVREYTREAGVRQLSRELAKLCRGVALDWARRLPAETGESAPRPTPVRVEVGELPKLLGRPRFFQEIAERSRPPGVAAGLAWTPAGGDVLYVETTRMKGKGKVEITGQLGEVMSESARAALAYLRSYADVLGVDATFLENTDLHIHVPAGAVPKDGPSAGVTMFTALASLLTGRRVRPDTAMTGEATLRGRVLPVGGIKSKVLAAHRAGFERVLLPKQNERDLDEIPESVRDELEIVLVDDMREVFSLALEAPEVVTGDVIEAEVVDAERPEGPTLDAAARDGEGGDAGLVA